MAAVYSVSTREERQVYISNRTRDVVSLGRAFAEALDTNALADLAYAVQDLGRQVEDLQREVRNKVAAARLADPLETTTRKATR